MAMMITKTSAVERTKLHDFRRLCAEALSGFADGRLPGDLGDAPEAVETGEARKHFTREEL